jgi:hypothetical protein
MRHVSACTMHGRRGGALVRLASQRTAALGGGHALWAASARQHFRADFPPDSAAGAGQLHLRSAQRAAILTSGAGRSGPSRLCAPYGWLAEADIKLDLIACVGGVIGMHNTKAVPNGARTRKTFLFRDALQLVECAGALEAGPGLPRGLRV